MEKDFAPNGYFISNGPGDPSAMPYAIDTEKDILKADKPCSVSAWVTSY